MRRVYIVLMPLLVLGLCLLGHRGQAEEAPVKPKAPVVQMAILLDTSGSMSGLINQARAQLWNIVNELALAKRGGQAPELQLALYQYGNDGLPAQGGYIQQILPFTNDLDKVSEKLFALTTNGGSEFCGQVIQQATDELGWNSATDVMKVIFIAGNEPFTQGKVDFHTSCKASITKGITINTIFCGNQQEGATSGWKDGALLAEGTYMSIDMNQRLAEIATPQDAELARLNVALNGTYIPYGTQGRAGQMNQVAQDANAATVSASVAASRAATKGSANYSNATWDLVDAVKNNTVKLEDVKDADLPAEMQKMTPAERKTFVEKQSTERAKLQADIAKLNTTRQAFITAEQKKLAKPGEKTLLDAMLEAVRQQAVKQGFVFEEAKAK
ncbi:MAG: VWA domain-containing protein [Armatimonadota bacterium]